MPLKSLLPRSRAESMVCLFIMIYYETITSQGLAFASGSVTTATIVNMFPSGSHVISVNDVYGGTFRYYTKVASNNGIETSFIDLNDPENLRKAIKPNTKVTYSLRIKILIND